MEYEVLTMDYTCIDTYVNTISRSCLHYIVIVKQIKYYAHQKYVSSFIRNKNRFGDSHH